MIGVQGKLYLVGGIGSSSGNLTEYNPRTDTWRSVGSMGRVVKHAVCSVEYKMFIVWGAGQVTKVFKLDAENDIPHEITFTANLHVDHVTLALGEKIYVIGGCFVGVQGVSSDVCEAYNIKTGTKVTT